MASRTHELKTWPIQFQAILDGTKRFELREDDRGFMVGDVLRLREWDPRGGSYTGREARVRVTYLLVGGPFSFGLPLGMSVMSIEPLPDSGPAHRLRAKRQPCGCVVCTCGTDDRCLGCGAKNCRTPDCVFKGDCARIVYAPAPESVETCGACLHARRCEGLLGPSFDAASTACDWTPTRWRPAAPTTQAPDVRAKG